MSYITSGVSAGMALVALREIRASLDLSRSRIATGLKIRGASDDPSIWMASAMLRSNRTMTSAVRDALNVGAAKVDTANLGLSQVLQTLSDLRSKIVLASQSGGDRTGLQGEIAGLQQQMRSIATGSSFLAENWLSVDSGAPGYTTTRSVAAFAASTANGSSSPGMIGFDIRQFVLFDANPAGGGLLDAPRSANASISGLVTAADTGVAARDAAASDLVYAVDLGDLEANQKIYFRIRSDAKAADWYEMRVPAVPFSDVAQFAAALQSTISDFATVDWIPGTSSISLKSKTFGSASSIAIEKINAYHHDPSTNYTAWFSSSYYWDEVEKQGSSGLDAIVFRGAQVSMGSFDAVTLREGESIRFKVSVDGSPERNVTIDKALIDSVLAGANGTVADVAGFRSVVERALQNAGVTGVEVGVSAGAIQLRSSATSGVTRISVLDVSSDRSTSVMDIDVVGKNREQIALHMASVDFAIERVKQASTAAGALSSSFDIQSRYNGRIAEILDETISHLVDADLESEIAKLKALEVREKLAIQALSIGNRSVRNVLLLFQ